MPPHHVQLQYRIADGAQPGAALDNELYALLAALHAQGSIRRAAAAAGLSYRHVWGAMKRWEQLLGAPLLTWTQGHPARLTPLAQRLLQRERLARVRLAPLTERLRAELELVLAEAQHGAMATLRLHGSAEPTLSALREAAASGASLHLDWHDDTSFGALRALAEGRCDIAAVHRPPPTTVFDGAIDALLAAGRHTLLLRRQRSLGLMLAPGNPLLLQVLPALARHGVRCVLRPAGSGTQALLEQQLQAQGVALAALHVASVEPSHAAAAAAVACGLADAALGTAAAAQAAGLDFVPLLHDDWLLLGAVGALATPAGAALRATLAASAPGR